MSNLWGSVQLSAFFYGETMKIGRYTYEIEWLAVLFEVIDEEGRLVCGITLDQLSDQGGLISGDEGLKIFTRRIQEIETIAAAAVENARKNGLVHTVGVKNDPLFLKLN